ncbi:3-hydroxy-9,10-secoandrosta-1,3,5(10)-triene-9,17-dione monooxygenase [Spinactinospora alkalitolerans]|uniref:3-hydroxy-9,10-secoandrosta-1,3,5(10)-triene-9, 17-dione monooxygenase n=1 Tax=Spinactinospora alkalitolerans TaxID=687207 RepID=A0A852TV52_9ACTN|nr:acyl-CoA dehydrogenase family protein [Spinactinospora alkalitolerans]NYE47177.1 3-hydroxy-9,10-secoandrosta-1,3,5(10)-triene-9,17-dione monooxygenase [Spinactinospora alkalitolerans]
MAITDRARRSVAEFTADEGSASTERRLPDSTWKHLMDTGVLRALQPARWGGEETPLVDFLDAVFEVARAAPSAGWVAGVVGSHPWQLALFPEETQQEVWGEDPTRMLSSSYAPTGKVEPVEGGYRVSGRWSFSSGCDHCGGVILGGVAGEIEAGDSRVPDYGSLILLREEYRIDDTWFTSGLRGTGSKDIVVDDVFVPARRFLSHHRYEYHPDVLAPGQETNPGPCYRLPWATFFNLVIAVPTLGMAQGFLDSWTAATRKRRANWGGFVSEDPLTQRHLAHAYWTLDAAIMKTRRVAIEMTEAAQAGVHIEKETRARYRWDITRGCELVGDAVSDLYRVSSGRVAYVDHPLHSQYQNIVTALGHAFLAADANGLAYGARLLGATPPEVQL